MQSIQVPSKAARWAAIAGALAVNAVPIVGVVFWGWSAFALILLYWLENLVLGVRTLLSMTASGLNMGVAGLGLLVLIPFFILHYGLFCFVHGVFVIALFGQADVAAYGESAFDLASLVLAIFSAQPNLLIGFAAISLWQAAQFVIWLARGDAGRTNPISEMSAPYLRIVTLHVAILGGGFLLMLLGWPIAGVLALAAMKTLFDVSLAWSMGAPVNDPAQKQNPWSSIEAMFKALRARRGPSQSPEPSPARASEPPEPRS